MTRSLHANLIIISLCFFLSFFLLVLEKNEIGIGKGDTPPPSKELNPYFRAFFPYAFFVCVCVFSLQSNENGIPVVLDKVLKPEPFNEP